MFKGVEVRTDVIAETSFPTQTSSGFPAHHFQADNVLEGAVADNNVDAID